MPRSPARPDLLLVDVLLERGRGRLVVRVPEAFDDRGHPLQRCVVEDYQPTIGVHRPSRPTRTALPHNS